MKSFYVDNCVTSISNEDTLYRFIEESKHILATACFDLRGWEHTSLKIGRDPSDPIPILGLLWNKDNIFCDTTVLKCSSFDLTRRNVLSVVHKIFNPLGVLSPATLIPKLLIQKSWNLKIDWDTVLPDNYIRENFLPENDTISVSFVCANCRIAPFRKTTIPRLELLACYIGARLSTVLVKAFSLENIPVFYWSDSSTSLYWIERNENWGVFVKKRVQEIKSLTSNGTWKHFTGNLNAADLPYQGFSISALVKLIWWEGPDWLKGIEEKWPKTEAVLNDEDIQSERRKLLLLI
ncbi:uncharacterized protein NPIL_43771 [Nephila pilipes]|uniref:Uncharacterized protein n=1 Tax=Nephila pilipes TaxID=299642 RepID=A0A8X6TR68_NEPPI|nr:uncharacterized protein NPIL_43771 [Nephila pilipes]